MALTPGYLQVWAGWSSSGASSDLFDQRPPVRRREPRGFLLPPGGPSVVSGSGRFHFWACHTHQRPVRSTPL